MRLKIILYCLGMVVLSCLLSGYNTTPETTGEKACLDCHGEKMKEKFGKKYVHYPFGQKECESCHDAKAFKLVSPVEELCFICHSDKEEEAKKPSVHTPFKMGMCTNCHDPHSSGNKKQLVEAGGALCHTCHGEDTFTKVKFTHFPAAKGNCLLCHQHHAGEIRKNLQKEVADICANCHSADTLGMHHPSGVTPSDKLTVSSDAKEHLDAQGYVTCASCHNPHGTDLPFFLRKTMEKGSLCYECHKTN